MAVLVATSTEVRSTCRPQKQPERAMRLSNHALEPLHNRRRWRRAKLAWAELEAEAARQGCSPGDIFFDWAGRPAGAPIPPAPTRTRAVTPRHAPGPGSPAGARSGPSRDEHRADSP